MQVVVYIESAGDTLLVENDVINVNHINNLFLSLPHHYHGFFTGGLGIDLVGHLLTKMECVSNYMHFWN